MVFGAVVTARLGSAPLLSSASLGEFSHLERGSPTRPGTSGGKKKRKSSPDLQWTPIPSADTHLWRQTQRHPAAASSRLPQR